MKPIAKRKIGPSSDAYLELIKCFPLASIRSEAHLDAAQVVIDDLITQELDEGGTMYLEALSDLVIHYESEHHAMPSLPAHNLLTFLLEERKMSQADLIRATGLAKATVSDLASGKRAFTVEQMRIVGTALGVPGKLFLPAN